MTKIYGVNGHPATAPVHYRRLLVLSSTAQSDGSARVDNALPAIAIEIRIGCTQRLAKPHLPQ